MNDKMYNTATSGISVLRYSTHKIKSHFHFMTINYFAVGKVCSIHLFNGLMSLKKKLELQK